jgi:hypothetical protein
MVVRFLQDGDFPRGDRDEFLLQTFYSHRPPLEGTLENDRPVRAPTWRHGDTRQHLCVVGKCVLTENIRRNTSEAGEWVMGMGRDIFAIGDGSDVMGAMGGRSGNLHVIVRDLLHGPGSVIIGIDLLRILLLASSSARLFFPPGFTSSSSSSSFSLPSPPSSAARARSCWRYQNSLHWNLFDDFNLL